MFFTQRLMEHYRNQPTRDALIFVNSKGEIKSHYSYQKLLDESVKIAQFLQQTYPNEQHIMLMYGQSIEFVSAFIGCLFAGKVAVPVFPPANQAIAKRLQYVISDSHCKVVLTTEAIAKRMKRLKVMHSLDEVFSQFKLGQRLSRYVKNQLGIPSIANLYDVDWIITDRLEQGSNQFIGAEITGNDLAFLQYTSGSTGHPKGVMVSHGNIQSNLEVIRKVFALTEQDRGFSWLPLIHDMGLIGMVLVPLYVGFPVFIMSPMQFVHNPLSWLHNINRFNITTTGGPNFAFDLCAKHIAQEEEQVIDISSLRVVYSGSECIRKKTIDSFYKAASRYHIKNNTQLNVYGLAEATLIVTGCKIGEVKEHDQRICCGQSAHDHLVKIVCPNTLKELPQGQIGEIWVQGPSVASGYWNKPELSEKQFHVKIKGNESLGGFLRSGDKG